MKRSIVPVAVSSLGCLSLCFVVVIAITLPAQSVPLPEGTIQVPGGTGTWIDAPASLPAGTRMLLLEGHPGSEGFFTMRLRLPAGARLQPHWHPADERVTVLSGLVQVGFGDRFDEAAMTTFGPGSFYLNPARSHHYVWVAEPTEMQLTGMGPWELHMLEQPSEELGLADSIGIHLGAIAGNIARRRPWVQPGELGWLNGGSIRAYLSATSARMAARSP
jgi:quercetin dioxygenase-like cupin family protein